MSKGLTPREFPGTATSFADQMQSEVGPITLVNTFVMKSHADEKLFLENWERDGNHMKKQYGMLSGQLHRTIGPEGNIFLNVAVWESTEHFRKAFMDPEFKKFAAGYPDGTVMYPVLLTKVAVTGVCAA